MVLAGPAVALSSGAFDTSERLGALLRHFECSALMTGVAKLSQHKRHIAWKLDATVASMPVHGVSGTGSSLVDWCV